MKKSSENFKENFENLIKIVGVGGKLKEFGTCKENSTGLCISLKTKNSKTFTQTAVATYFFCCYT